MVEKSIICRPITCTGFLSSGHKLPVAYIRSPDTATKQYVILSVLFDNHQVRVANDDDIRARPPRRARRVLTAQSWMWFGP